MRHETDYAEEDRDKRTPADKRRWLRTSVAVICVLVVAAVGWFVYDRAERSRLARDTRVVVLIPESVVDRLTADEIEEQFPIDETAGELEVTGTANAVGRVSIEIHPHAEPDRPDDAMIRVRVEGESDNELIGVKSPVKIIGDGQGTFEADKHIHFDGRLFTAEGETRVEATHETDIVEVEPLPGTPFRGAVRLLASRNARAALPELNALAARRIEELVRKRVDELIAETIEELNRLNRFDETVARLHPDSERWDIAVAARDGFVQAALVPEGGRSPTLPISEPTTLEVWLRLSRTQRRGLNLISQWRQSHRLFRTFVPEEQSRRLADEMIIVNRDGWTCLRIGARALDAGES